MWCTEVINLGASYSRIIPDFQTSYFVHFVQLKRCLFVLIHSIAEEKSQESE